MAQALTGWLHPPHPATGSTTASSANALAGKLTLGGVTSNFGPVAPVSGQGTGYDSTATLHDWGRVYDLKPGSRLHPTVQFTESEVKTSASSPAMGIDTRSSSAEVNIGSSTFLLTDNPASPRGILGILGLTFAATDIHVSAGFSQVFGMNQPFLSGDASFGSLTIGGALIGQTLTFSGDAAPNTVLFSSPTVTITLDKQVVTDLTTPGHPPKGITTEAVDITFHNATFAGMQVSGEIVIGIAIAGTT